jgi:diaminobutyrate-2-oxoglutarate transaminase
MNIFASSESIVRSYCRAFPARFETARGSSIFTVDGVEYLDFLSGCGSLNYGHNVPVLKEELLDYIANDSISMSMDLETTSKEKFLTAFNDTILAPRNLNYRVQFTGPTGANAVESAIKLARKVTGRSNVIAFTNAFHGCSLGALSLTGNQHQRESSSSLLNQVTRMPYDGYFGDDVDTSDMLAKMLDDPSSGIDKPAAIIFEAVQGEGGLNCASQEWAQKIQAIAEQHGALLIVDEIQSGVGRTGSFFAFEPLGIKPDIVCLAKAISGYGLPMSLTLFKPEYDVWKPGEHNGTFRGNNLAFVTATAAILHFWQDETLMQNVRTSSAQLTDFASKLTNHGNICVKGKGLMTGFEFDCAHKAKRIQTACFENGLIIELCGPTDAILKPLPALNISQDTLDRGLGIIGKAISKSG